MTKMNAAKYRPAPVVDLPDRMWPSRTITHAPMFCSVDLRDGNQALPVPMNPDEKLELFQLLVAMGLKEIEVAFPSASDTEFRFMRRLIEGGLIPPDVTIQVLTQARLPLIERTFEAIQGARRAIIHLYNSTSELQRRVVFNKDKKGIVELAVTGAEAIRDLAAKNPGIEIVNEYSPESFHGTELDFALEICNRVLDVWQPSPTKKTIINLPATVENTSPNVFADKVEWFGRHLTRRNQVILCVHAHNDRGTGVATSELALLAGADRLEGTLFGNGERTGNMDLITLGMNLFSQGIDPGLDFSRMDHIISVYEKCTKLAVDKRSPYAGELVYTAFSGSHQDAIRKGLMVQSRSQSGRWEVPYLPVDPSDVGRAYEAIIRINSQSGKGGAAYVMESAFGYKLPKAMHPEFGKIVQVETDRTGRELTPADVFQLFKKEYLGSDGFLQLIKCDIEEKAEPLQSDAAVVSVSGRIRLDGRELDFRGQGNGPIDAFFQALKAVGVSGYKFISYDEHALEAGADSSAVAYIHLEDASGKCGFGVGIAPNISVASLKALLNAINRLKK